MNATLRIASALLALTLLAGPAAAEDVLDPPETLLTPPVEQADEAKGFFERKHTGYLGYMFGELDKIGELDIYGVSGQLPKGYLGLKYQWTTITAGSRFQADGTEGPVATPIEFTNPAGERLISIDLGLEGKGHGHTFMLSYGISNPVDFYIEVPFTFMNVKLKPKIAEINEAGDKIDPDLARIAGYDPQTYGTADFLYDTLPRLGRAPVPTGYKGEWLLGDINMGVSWNFQRNPRFSNSMTMRAFLPTGKVQNANNSLLYGTGPALDTSIGGWAIGMTHGFDVRIFRAPPFLDIIFSTESTWSYGFKQRRPYPTNFTPPDPALASLDPSAFPDLSKLGGGKFDYTPGFSVDALAGVQIRIAIIGLAAAYGISYSQTPWLDGDRDFLSMVNSLELIGQSSMQSLQLGAGISFLPFIPASLNFTWQKAVRGNNSIVFDDYYQISVQAFVPLYKLWE